MNLCTYAPSVLAICCPCLIVGTGIGYLIALAVRRPDRSMVVSGGPSGRVVFVDDSCSSVKIGGDLDGARRLVIVRGDLGNEEWDSGSSPVLLDAWLRDKGMRA
jgi:hypothetical protein